MQPIKEGKKGGVLGGLKGVGMGVMGLAFKPAAGVVDMVSSTMVRLGSCIRLGSCTHFGGGGLFPVVLFRKDWVDCGTCGLTVLG